MEWTSPVAPLMTVALERTTKRFGRSSTTQEPPSLRELVNHLGIPTQSSRRVRFGLVARAPAPLCPPASPSAGLEGLYVAGATQESSLSRREAVAQESQMKFRVFTFRSAVCKTDIQLHRSESQTLRHVSLLLASRRPICQATASLQSAMYVISKPCH